MEFWQRIHWFITSACNEKCRFCFKPDFENCNPKNISKLAEILTENEVKKVIFTGGEPLLQPGLEQGMKILDDAKIDVTLHTNATLLTKERLDILINLVDEIAVPIDTLDRKLQRYLRRKDCLPKVQEVLEDLQYTKLKIGIHTVATALNINQISQIYDFLSKKRFDYWKIYEFNPQLIKNGLENIIKYKTLKKLRGKCEKSYDGGVNILFADFLLQEEKMQFFNDKRMQFVGVNDFNREPYFFLNSLGEAYFCNWFLQGERVYFGNILTEGFQKVKDKMVKADNEGIVGFENSFIETRYDQPLWVRAAWEGNYLEQQLEAVKPKYMEKFVHLSTLYLERAKKQGMVPKSAKVQYLV